MILAHAVLVLTLIYACASALYLLAFSVAGRVAPARSVSPARCTGLAVKLPRIAVLVPAYKEDAVIVDTARRALTHDYPAHAFDVVVIDDQLGPATRRELGLMPVRVVEADFERSTKVKALALAIDRLGPAAYDAVVILDADNVMAPGFLRRMAGALVRGARVVQGRRIAKNRDTGLAGLDALSEAANNHVFRLGHRALGLSAALIGSGMAFEYGLFDDLIHSNRAIGGFDKELELEILRRGVTIEYDHEAVVLDEKVSVAGAFTRQRSRWLSAQLYYAARSVRHLPGALRRGQFDYADKIVQMFLPPRALLFALIPIGALAAAVSSVTPLSAWLAALAILVTALVVALPELTGRQLARGLLHLPAGVALMLVALVRSPWSNRTFLHTTHTVTDAAPPRS